MSERNIMMDFFPLIITSVEENRHQQGKPILNWISIAGFKFPTNWLVFMLGKKIFTSLHKVQLRWLNQRHSQLQLITSNFNSKTSNNDENYDGPCRLGGRLSNWSPSSTHFLPSWWKCRWIWNGECWSLRSIRYWGGTLQCLQRRILFWNWKWLWFIQSIGWIQCRWNWKWLFVRQINTRLSLCTSTAGCYWINW